MPWRSNSQPTTAERVVGGLSYLTMGFAALLYILLSKNGNQSQFFRFHMYQSVFLCIVSILAGWAAGPLLNIVLQLVSLVSQPAALGMASVIGVVAQVIQGAFMLLLLYGAIFAFLGKFAEVPYVSNLIRRNSP
jgi:uncharacterized membrane protein